MRIPTLMPTLYRINTPASSPTVITKAVIPLRSIPERSVVVNVDVVIVPNVVIDLDIVSPVNVITRVNPVPSNDTGQGHCATDARSSLSRPIDTRNGRICGAIGFCGTRSITNISITNPRKRQRLGTRLAERRWLHTWRGLCATDIGRLDPRFCAGPACAGPRGCRRLDIYRRLDDRFCVDGW